MVLTETALGFGSNPTWFEVKSHVVFNFKQNQPVIFLNPPFSTAVKSGRRYVFLISSPDSILLFRIQINRYICIQ